MSARCFLCGTRAFSRGRITCDTCGARWQGDTAKAAARFRDAVLEQGPFPQTGAGTWFVDTFTARIGATAYDLWLELPDGQRLDGHDDAPPRGTFRPLADAEAPPVAPVAPIALVAPVALVALARPDDPALPGFLALNTGRFAQTVLVLDGETALDAPGVTIVRRRLAGDFAAQRNAGMAAVTTPWAFHLDLDETASDAFVARLGPLAAAAEGAGLEAVGFPRRNLVDGVVSDLYPDIQYRLVARDQRYGGRVHELPEACRHWPRTTIALGHAMNHHLDGARVRERTRAYDAMGQPADRHDDERALLRPYRA